MAFADDRDDTIANPKVVIEILSPESQDYDYGTKFVYYRSLPSLEEYVLVSQSERLVEVYRRAPDAHWILSSYARPAAEIPLVSLGILLPSDDIYADVVE